MQFSKQDFKIGAIYRLGIARKLTPAALADLLSNRASLKPDAAKQLVAHWLTSEPYRRAA